MRFHPSSVQRSAEWGTTGSGQPAPEDGEAAWYWSAAPALGLGPASDVPLSWVPGLGAAEKRSTTWRGRGWRLSKVGDASFMYSCRDTFNMRHCKNVPRWTFSYSVGRGGHTARARVGRGARSSAGWGRCGAATLEKATVSSLVLPVARSLALEKRTDE
jgi:hypothetical protein